MASPEYTFETATGRGSVHDVPGDLRLDALFESYLVPVDDGHIHAVIGGSGRPLLLLAGWPQNWFAFRYLMRPLAAHFTVIAADPRGVGLSDKPETGYDTDSRVADMFALMDALGHQYFAMLGHDIGMWTGYAMAADRPDRIERIILSESLILGVSPSPPLLPDDRRLSDMLWHHNFNRAMGINEQLVRGREELYFRHQFATKAASPDAVPRYAQDLYIEQLENPDALRASFEFYRALDLSLPQHRRRGEGDMLKMPVLTIAGEYCCGEMIEAEMATLAEHLRSEVIADCGHYPAEEKPAEFLALAMEFLEGYRRENPAA